jgi:hypothetical protein
MTGRDGRSSWDNVQDWEFQEFALSWFPVGALCTAPLCLAGDRQQASFGSRIQTYLSYKLVMKDPVTGLS